jgi:hypothetical protein
MPHRYPAKSALNAMHGVSPVSTSDPKLPAKAKSHLVDSTLSMLRGVSKEPTLRLPPQRGMKRSKEIELRQNWTCHEICGAHFIVVTGINAGSLAGLRSSFRQSDDGPGSALRIDRLRTENADDAGRLDVDGSPLGVRCRELSNIGARVDPDRPAL